jgi:hypothetical protein
MMVQRDNLEEISWTDIHAVTARGTFIDIDNWQSIVIHLDRVEGASDLAVRQSEAAPRTALSTSGNHMGRCAVRIPLIGRNLLRLALAPSAMKTGDALLLFAGVDS